MEYVILFISAVFVNNIILAQFLGICPFLGVSSKISTAVGMSGAVVFVMTLASIITFFISNYLLASLDIMFLQTISFILVIASLVQMVEIILKKISPAMYQALGIFLPLITTNCAVLGVAIMNIQREYTLMESIVFAIASAIGFGIAMVLFAGLREHSDLLAPPKAMKGAPLSLITAGILALAFMGFAGLV